MKLTGRNVKNPSGDEKEGEKEEGEEESEEEESVRTRVHFQMMVGTLGQKLCKSVGTVCDG